jgi:hypothetical protein
MFENNFEKLRQIFSKIGFDYTDDIFDNTKYLNNVQYSYNIPIPSSISYCLSHTETRLYQINQPFINNNDKSKINLLNSQIDTLTNDENILKIYPEIKNIILNP